MRTLVAILSYGDRTHLSEVSFPRAAKWASRHGYSVILIKEPLHRENERPHYGKLRIPERFPGFDLYCIIDDDLLISAEAPAIPCIPTGFVGLVPDAEQRHTQNPDVQWTGNTGFILVDKNGLDLLTKACERGDDPTVWGIADQGALNSVAWAENRVFEMDGRWNYQTVLEYFLRGRGWESWRDSKIYRISYYIGMLLHWPHPILKRTRKCYGVHLIRCPYPRFFDFFLPKD